MSRTQWREWERWCEVRGPVGPQRWDVYVATLAMAAGPGGPYREGVDLRDFLAGLPWVRREDLDGPDDE